MNLPAVSAGGYDMTVKLITGRTTCSRALRHQDMNKKQETTFQSMPPVSHPLFFQQIIISNTCFDLQIGHNNKFFKATPKMMHRISPLLLGNSQSNSMLAF